MDEAAALDDRGNRGGADANDVDGIAVNDDEVGRLAALEASRRAARSSDQAAFSVAATSASSNVIPIAKHASAIANGMLGDSPAPGLTSVASATGTPASISCRAGANRPSFR